MSLRGLKVPVIVLTFAALLFAGLFTQRVLRDTRVMDPLQEQLNELDGVEEVRAEQRDGLTDLTVRLGPVDNLGDQYAQIAEIASNQLDGNLGEIEVVDNRSPALEDAFYHLHFALQEAIATGGFGSLEQAAQEVGARAGLAEQRIYVRAYYVAVQLVSQDGHYLYEILPRAALAPRRGVPGAR